MRQSHEAIRDVLRRRICKLCSTVVSKTGRVGKPPQLVVSVISKYQLMAHRECRIALLKTSTRFGVVIKRQIAVRQPLRNGLLPELLVSLRQVGELSRIDWSILIK
jgi:hypothetical protein